jgi:hypothetical protein
MVFQQNSNLQDDVQVNFKFQVKRLTQKKVMFKKLFVRILFDATVLLLLLKNIIGPMVYYHRDHRTVRHHVQKPGREPDSGKY